ncbi:unnamed protein product [Urochloa humidicola]
MWRATRSRRKQQQRQPSPTPEGTLLATLPTDLQNDVLGRLPARDAVRTSVLSPAWRRRWESVPNLDVDLNGIRSSSWDTAAATLQRCAAPIRRVRICGVPPDLADSTDAWLRIAAGKRPRSVSIDLPAAAVAAVPSLFACDAAALAELRLGSCVLPVPPAGFAGFHALEKLDLDGVIFLAENGRVHLEGMLAAAQGLEELQLRDIVLRIAGEGGGKLVIGGLRLRRLVVCLTLAGAGEWELGELPVLEYAHVYLDEAQAGRDYVKLFRALSNARKLKISNFVRATLQEPMIPGSLSHQFKNLRVLKLDTNFYVLSTYISTYCLLCQAPFLQVLEITDYFRDWEIAEVDLVSGCLLTTLLLHCSFLHNLEYLRMISISCSENDMQFIKHVLHTARNLQQVFVNMFPGSIKCAQEASRELKQCQRASPEARVSIKHGDSVCNA